MPLLLSPLADLLKGIEQKTAGRDFIYMPYDGQIVRYFIYPQREV